MKKTLLSLVLTSLIGSAYAVDITIAYDSDFDTLDPMGRLSQGTLSMGNMIFGPLVRLDHNLKPQAQLAESWEYLDDKTLRFHLRKGVKFHSGNDMTADDVIFSFERIKKSDEFKALYDNYDKMVKVDDHTVDLIFKQPYPLVMENISYMMIMDKKFYSGTDEKGQPKDQIDWVKPTFANVNESGTGPFKVVSRQKGVKGVYEKFDDYWNKENRGNVDKITLVIIKENATRVSALLSGDVDWIYPVPPTDLDRVKNNPKTTLYSMPSDRFISFMINQNASPELKDKRVREALVYAVNNKGIVDKVMRGNAVAGEQQSPEGYTGHNPDLKPRYDLEKAKTLMKEAGYEKGFTLTMISPNDRYVNDEKIAQSVAAMLAKINVKVNLTTLPGTQYWPEFDNCKTSLQFMGWSSDTGDSANYSEFLTMTKDDKAGFGQYNCMGYSNPELDKLVIESNQEIDPEKRKAILQKVSQIEYDDAAYIPLHWESLNWGYTKRFENFPEIVNLKNFPYWDLLKVEEKK